MNQRIHDAVAAIVRLEQHRPGTIPEQHARRAVRVVDDRRHLVGADDHYFSRGTVGNELRGDGERIKKARARGLHIEASDIAHANHVADQIGGGGKLQIRCCGGADEQVHLFRLCAGLLQQPAYRFGGHVRGPETFTLQDMTFLDARPLGNPGVAGVDQARQFRIGEQIRRQVAMNGRDRCARGKGQRLESGLLQGHTPIREYPAS